MEVRYQWVSRNKNKEADKLAGEARRGDHTKACNDALESVSDNVHQKVKELVEKAIALREEKVGHKIADWDKNWDM